LRAVFFIVVVIVIVIAVVVIVNCGGSWCVLITQGLLVQQLPMAFLLLKALF
jgi:hypothetical protein